jgi:hypothetical protein
MENFHRAAERHFAAASLLDENAQGTAHGTEASQLYAYAAECALKAILCKQGNKNPRGHINDHLLPKPKSNLIDAYQNCQQGRNALPLKKTQCFEGWTINERYADGTSIQAHLASHKADAVTIMKVFREYCDA